MSHEIEFTDEQRTLLRAATMFPGFTFNNDAELDYFITRCERSGLDPFAGQIFPTRREGRMTITLSIDSYRLIAARSGAYAGSDDPVFAIDEKGNIRSATVTVYKAVAGIRCPFTATAHWAEFVVTGKGGFMWKKMPRNMIAKCAEAQALRKGFPEDLAGTESEAEMDHEGLVEATPVAPLVDNGDPYDETPLPEQPKPPPEPERKVIDPDDERFRTDFLKRAAHELIPPSRRDKAYAWAKEPHTAKEWSDAMLALGELIVRMEKKKHAEEEAAAPPTEDTSHLDQMLIEIEDAIEAAKQHLTSHPDDKQTRRTYDTIMNFWNNLDNRQPEDIRRMHKQIRQLHAEIPE